MKKIVLIDSSNRGPLNFRHELIEELNKKYDLTILGPSDEHAHKIREKGYRFCPIKLNRRGTNPISDYLLYLELKKHLKKIKPDLVITFAIKPNIYGGLAAKKLNIPYICNITGLGTALNNGGIIERITKTLYKVALKKVNVIFFQNLSNNEYFLENKITYGKHVITPGSGVNIEKYKILDFPINNPPIITYIGRIMTDKGINELLEAIKFLKENNYEVEFRFIGSFDDEQLKEKVLYYHQKGLINYIGFVTDVRKYMKETNAVINPTYHEGMSNVLLEAAASGRPVLASNVPGSKETFDEGKTGLGFISKNSDAIVQTIIKFLSLSNNEMKEMGLKGRAKMVEEFDRDKVVENYINIIDEII